ncbi:MAG TPA: CrcB family protein [Candidatus Tumulicola sp.]|nr:CrcB family protein [Candidatus Tumulicola sp.]
MKNLLAFIAVGAGGAIGSTLRYAVALWMVARIGPGFPWHTAAINVVGSFLIGVISVYAQRSIGFSPLASAFLTVGVLGGFTTFSTFSYDTLTLASEGAAGLAAAYCVGSVGAGLLAGLGGITVTRALLHAV